MRKIFLTSGLVLCMACPAFADLTAPTTTYPNGTIEGSNPVATPYCTEPTLEGYSGTSTFTAKWTPNTYTITYYPGVAKTSLYSHNVSGTATTQSVTFGQQSLTKANTATDLTDGPWSQTGYIFSGWLSNYNMTNNTSTPLSNDNTEGSTMYGQESPFTYNVPDNVVELYAIWHPVVSGQITLDSSIRENDAYNGTVIHDTQTGGVTAVSPSKVWSIYETGLYANTNDLHSAINALESFSIPSRTGYKFEGFFEQDGTTQLISSSGAIINDNALRSVSTETGTKTWYAHWDPNTYDAIYKKGLHGTGSDYTHTDGVTYDSVYTTLAQATTGITENAGYTFRGWSQNENAVYGTDTIITAGSAMASAWTTDSDLTLYAIYSPNQYTITYSCGSKPGSESQSGSVPSSQSINQDGTYNLAANTCVYQGWHFTGWHCDHTLNETGQALIGNTVNYQPGDTGTFKSATNVECTAQWEANNIITTWNLDGGSATQNGLTSCTYDSTIGLPQGVSKTGYTFGGWTVVNSNSSNSGGGDNNGGGNGGGSGSGNGDSTPVVDNGPAI